MRGLVGVDVLGGGRRSVLGVRVLVGIWQFMRERTMVAVMTMAA